MRLSILIMIILKSQSLRESGLFRLERFETYTDESKYMSQSLRESGLFRREQYCMLYECFTGQKSQSLRESGLFRPVAFYEPNKQCQYIVSIPS